MSLFIRYQPFHLSGGSSGPGITSIGTIDSEITPSSDGATIFGGSVLILQSASLTVPGLVNNAAQSFSGIKSFQDDFKSTSGEFFWDTSANRLYIGANTSSSNGTLTLGGSGVGVGTLDGGGGALNIQGGPLTLLTHASGQDIVFKPNNTTILTLTDTSATFVGPIIAPSLDVAATGGTDTLAIGTTNADIINMGRPGATINIQGTTLYENVSQLQVTDPLITINKGGGAGSGANSGIEVEEASSITAYFETSSDRNSWTIKAPNTAGIVTITPGAAGFVIDQASHSPLTLTAVGSVPNTNGASLSGQALTLQPADTSFPGVLLAADWNTFNNKQPAGNYITALTGEGTASGPGSVALTLSNSAVIGKVLTGYTSGAGTVAATDSILQAIQKLNGNILLVPGTVTSVALTVPGTSILGVTGSPVTSSGSLGITTTGTSGGIPYFSSTSQLASSALLAQYGVVVGGGAAAAPATIAPDASTTKVLTSGGTGANPSWQNVSPSIFGTQTANTVLSGPTSGGAATPTFRGLVAADIPVSISARYSTAAGQTIPTGTPTIVNFGTQNWDTNSAVTTGSSWHFTAPSAGKYLITTLVMFDNNNGFATANQFICYIFKNGSQGDVLDQYSVQTTCTAFFPLKGSTLVDLAANDTIDIRVLQNCGASRTLQANASYNSVSIIRMSN